MILLAFLRPYLKPIAGVLLVLATLAALLFAVHHRGYQSGVKAEQDAQAERVEKAKKRVKEGDKRANAANTAIATKHVQTVEKIRWRTETLTKEVTVYVPQTVDRVYRLPAGLVRVHDAAASGSDLPAAPGGSVEEPSDVTPSQFATAIVGNYGTCRVWESEALTWRNWYVTQRDIYNATTGQKP
ncbi:Na+-transporting methylmalonyl-CoA/oxaloacetate decarboxylase gamma subunit [Caulobacter sp. BE264]|uniref:hypothetical protein n=1 Tax=Caulobacter sp. BE264 TaxID=2817724 RepID=UPI00285DE045|nr:hypothetical protein [Caulobacter sp. BE264]MDR7232065.1 Na+-transporting methylmalonyl-CoA/oxaloacetate decarboxylase gamma subunit [Caulobacter sp. BE264]